MDDKIVSKAKSPILLLIVLIIISLSLAGSVFFLLQKEKAKNVSLQEQLDETSTRLKITEAKLEESKKIAFGLEGKLKEAKAEIEKLYSDLDQEKNTKQEALTQVEQLKVDLENQKNLRADLENKLGIAKKDMDKAQTQLKELSAKKDELEKKIKDLEVQAQATQEQGVELGKVVVTSETVAPQTAKSASKPAPASVKPASVKPASVKPENVKPASENPVSGSDGKILVVNNDYNFVVINIGNKEGVEIGELFSIYRGNKYIGDVKVEKVHDSMSAAGFVTPDIKDKVSEGDRVVRKTK